MANRRKVDQGMPLGVVQPLFKIWLSQQECAVYMGCSEEWIRENVRCSGEVEVCREKGIFWYRLEDIDRFISSRNVLKK